MNKEKKTYSEINKEYFKLTYETFHSDTIYTKEQYVQIIYHLAQLARDMELIHDEEIKHLRDTLGKKLAQEQFKRQRIEEELDNPKGGYDGFDAW
jgi:hypothetical protein